MHVLKAALLQADDWDGSMQGVQAARLGGDVSWQQ